MLIVGEVADLIDAEQMGRAVVAETSAAEFGRVDVELVEQLGGGEQDAVAGQHRTVGDVFGDHGLAQPIGAQKEQITPLGDELQGEGRFKEAAVDLLRPVPVEVRHDFEAAEF